MDQVVDLVSRMAEVVGTTGDNQDSVNMEANIQQSLAGASGARMAKAIQGIASRVEDKVAKVVAPPRAAQATTDGARAPHATVIKQVRHAHRKLLMAKQVDGASPENYWQPYLGAAVAQMQQGAPATKGAMMLDMGASITLVTRKWLETHGLTITPVSGISITGANGAPVDMVGTCSMMV